jgi:hypothetical protein
MDSVYGELSFGVGQPEFRGMDCWGTRSSISARLAAAKRALFLASSPSSIDPIFTSETDRTVFFQINDISDSGAIGSALEQATTAGEMLQRVIALEAAFYEDFGRQLVSDSRDALDCLVKYHPFISIPSLGADEDGIIVATWVKDGDWFSLRFASRYKLEFAVSMMEDGVRRRRWGRSTLVTLFDDCPPARNLLR